MVFNKGIYKNTMVTSKSISHWIESENVAVYADFKIAYYGAMNEASCRLSGGLIMPLWDVLWNNRLKKEMKKLKADK